MKQTLTLIMLFIMSWSISSQVIFEEYQSRQLNSKRQLKIKLPDNYDPESELKHPVIVVFDGEYLFGPVNGQVSFQTYFDEMPESIIVGVYQGKERFYDSFYDEVSGLPFESGQRFYNFVAQELIPYIDANYNTSKFKVAVGHNIMGNFINAFLFHDTPIFQAYINLSPDFQGKMNDNVATRLEWLEDDIFYYMATSDKDIKRIKEKIQTTNQQLNALDNQKLTYYYDELKGDSHYQLVTGALSKAMDRIFELYKPLDEKELREKVLPYEGTLDDYIVDRYERIDDLFGIFKPISEEELQQLVIIAEERKDLESVYKIGKLANKLNPNSSFGTYHMALYAEKLGKTKKAVKLYESALTLEDMSHIDREFILSHVEDLKIAEDDTEVEDDEN
ncbi:alpha/beta hydrolase-fold protein [Psychroserpens sp.]|uniref:alpha/beta hydrolase-fold protein n=1 Tax=Psychroserpens sp. TaxID=2020870 RepID=UPI001B156387|nr:alpha/beta hydrolase-fold protein [Psychroserpens sp.]MBO6605564.1 esterase [Psychroserpens sp.]MBO6630023.1 esterase [Psychroserpens sp.]MBO6653627.1 esterase [Psychroserpens sp.]MBO6681948.1 esterase [Psychroserpens sp.]MBO6748938.1 esterase [Psychroserpens sp.]